MLDLYFWINLKGFKVLFRDLFIFFLFLVRNLCLNICLGRGKFVDISIVG